jgi:hypothetical protein
MSNFVHFLLFLGWVGFFGLTYYEQLTYGRIEKVIWRLLPVQWLIVFGLLYALLNRSKPFGLMSETYLGIVVLIALIIIWHVRTISKPPRLLRTIVLGYMMALIPTLIILLVFSIT